MPEPGDAPGEGIAERPDGAGDVPLVAEVVPPALAGERLDRVVAFLTGCSRSEAAAWIAEGRVRLGRSVATKTSVRVGEGDRLRVQPPTPPDDRPPADPSVVVQVVYEDADLVVVDKPAGLVVHPGAGRTSGTLVHGLLARYPEIAEVGERHRPGIVHRLDAGTSGLLLVARSARAYAALVDQLARHEVDRRYLALVWGHFDAAAGLVDAPVGRSTRQRTAMAVTGDGKPARTWYEVERAFDDPAAVTLVRCRLETGRTHQIRVHLSAIGHAVVGDDRYGGRRRALSVPRPMLHAAALALQHPVDARPLEFHADIPDDFAAVLASLR